MTLKIGEGTKLNEELLDQKKRLKPIIVSIGLLYGCALLITCGLGGVIFPILLAAGIIYFGFTPYYYVTWPLVVVINDALGTVYAGKIAFVWVMLVSVIIHAAIVNRKRFVVSKRLFVIIILLILWSMYVSFTQPYEKTDFLYKSLPMIIAFLFIYKEIEDSIIERDTILEYMVASIVILIVAAVFFGRTTADESYILRNGLLGTGVGDPNYSAFKIVLASAITLMSKRIHWIVKVLVISLCVYMLALTASLTGFILLGTSFLLFALINQPLSTKIRRLFFILLGLFLGAYLVLNLGVLQNIPEFNAISTRISILNGTQYVAGTEGGSGRLGLIKTYVTAYFSNIPAINMIFGGITLPSNLVAPYYSHNTYVDALMRFGAFGTIVILKYAISGIIDAFRNQDKMLFVAKIIVFLFSMSISIYSGDAAATWFALLFVM